MKLSFVLIILITHYSVSPQEKPSITPGKAILLSDIHFNPFSQPELFDSLTLLDGNDWGELFDRHPDDRLPGDGDDSNYALFRSLIRILRDSVNSADLMIINGDYLGHDFEDNFNRARDRTGNKYDFKSFVYKTILFLARSFDKAFPSMIIVPVIGNNDTDTTDYYWRSDTVFFKNFATAWFPLLRQTEKERKETIRQFLTGGYYSFILNRGTRRKIIALNSVLFHDARSYGRYARQGQAQLEWLRKTLDDKIPCWMAYHIPPGVDVFQTAKKIDDGGHMFWEEKLTKSFGKIVSTFAAGIRINLVSHTHKDDFRILYDDNSKPVSVFHFIPSVSLSNHNNSAFQVLYFNQANFSVLDYDTYFLDVSSHTKTWAREYNFRETYGVKDVTALSMHNLLKRLEADSSLRNLFIKYYNSSLIPVGTVKFISISDKWQPLYIGAMKYLSKDQFSKYLGR